MAEPGPDRERLLALLASEIDVARGEIEALAAALCADVEVMARHIDGLQALDHAGQRCATIAGILRSADLLAAVRQSPLESIVQRLSARG